MKLAKPGVKLHLGGIGKGFAVAARALAQLPEDADARKVEEAQEFELDMASAAGKESDQ